MIGLRALVRSPAVGRAARMFSAAAAPTAEELDKKYLLGTYSGDGVRLMEGLVIERGEGSKLWDSHGREYIDFFAGIAVNALGHSDPGTAEVIAAQARKTQHLSNILHSPEPLALARTLVEGSKHFDKVFFCNSGTEANEGALKIAKKYWLVKAMKAAQGIPADSAQQPAAYTAYGCKGTPPTQCFTQGGMCGCWPSVNNNNIAAGLKSEVLAFKNSFHGRTMGSLAATHKPAIRMPFGPFPSDVRYARFNNLDDVHKQWNSKVGAVIIEPVQGEGGIYPADAGFMRALRQLCTQHGALMIVDEVQCGLGRTGRVWAHEAYDVAPDLMTLAKPLAGGLPIGAIMMTDEVAKCIVPGDHGTTFGGNPFVTRVADYVFKRISDPAFLATTRERGRELITAMNKLWKKYPDVIREVRGTLDGGLFVGVDCIKPFKPIQLAAARRGLLIISAGENTIRLCPPLVITKEELAKGCAILDDAIAEAYGSPYAHGVGKQ